MTDILEDLRKENDFLWILKNYEENLSYFKNYKSKEFIKLSILNSHEFKYELKLLSDKKGKTEKELMKEAECILNGMNHNMTMSNIRLMIFILSKTYKRLYSHVFVNIDGIDKLRELTKDSCVILLPTHRSYADFLLVSFLTFYFNLPMPAIAAATDFMNMKFVGEHLRRCGAFFIRRSFVDDDLYWSTFSYYIKTLVKISQESLEFFIEGTRSRTNKSLYPKIGMLGILLEMWLSGSKDIKIVPIGISYDRVLEEKLYAWELFGVPKPKESTSGLLKVRHILNESYGNVYFNIGDPISISDMAKQFGVNRIDHNLQLKFRPSLFENEKLFLRELSKIIVEDQQRNCIMSHWSIIVFILMNHRINQQTSLPIVTLCQLFTDFTALLSSFDVKLAGSLETNVLTTFEMVSEALNVHKYLVKYEGEAVSLIGEVDMKTLGKDKSQLDTIIVDIIHVGIYRNPLLFHVVKESLLIKRIRFSSSSDYQALYEDFKDVIDLFSREFIFAGSLQHNFDTALTKLRKSHLLIEEWSINDKHSCYSMMEDAVTVHVVAYILYGHVFMRDIVGNISSLKSVDQVKILQRHIIELCSKNQWLTCHYLEICSLDIARNALTQMTEIYKSKSLAVVSSKIKVLNNFISEDMKELLHVALRAPMEEDGLI